MKFEYPVVERFALVTEAITKGGAEESVPQVTNDPNIDE